MPLIRRKSTTKAGTFTSPRCSHNHSPGAKHRYQGASDGQRAHRCALCSCTPVRWCTASTCSEVRLALRAIRTTSWLAEPNGCRHTIHTGRAHRFPRLHCRRSNSQLQRRTLSRSLERPQRSAVSQVRVPGVRLLTEIKISNNVHVRLGATKHSLGRKASLIAVRLRSESSPTRPLVQ